MRFEVQHATWCHGWVNTWLDDTEAPITFASYAAAKAKLDAFLAEVQADIDAGERAAESGYGRDEFRIAVVARTGDHR